MVYCATYLPALLPSLTYNVATLENRTEQMRLFTLQPQKPNKEHFNQVSDTQYTKTLISGTHTQQEWQTAKRAKVYCTEDIRVF